MHINPTDLAILAGALVPLAVGAITKFQAPSWVKSSLMLVLSAISAVVTQVVAANGNFTWNGVLKQFAEIVVIAVAAHYGVYKPTGVAEVVKQKTAGLGIGPVDLTLPAPPGE